jgi:hypothetical protein
LLFLLISTCFETHNCLIYFDTNIECGGGHPHKGATWDIE